MGSGFRRKLGETLPEHAVEGWKWVNDIGEGRKRDPRFDREDELADDLARPWRDQRRADQHTTFAVAHELQRAAVKVMDGASRRVSRIDAGDDHVDSVRA